MNAEEHRKMLLSQYHDLASILHHKGLGNELPDDESIVKMSVNDLSEWIRTLTSVSRTPTE